MEVAPSLAIFGMMTLMFGAVVLLVPRGTQAAKWKLQGSSIDCAA